MRLDFTFHNKVKFFFKKKEKNVEICKIFLEFLPGGGVILYYDKEDRKIKNMDIVNKFCVKKIDTKMQLILLRT